MATTVVSVAAKVVGLVWAHSKLYRKTVASLDEEIRKALELHVSRPPHEQDTEFHRNVLYPRIGSCIKSLMRLKSEGALGALFGDSLDSAQVAINDLIAARRYMERKRWTGPPAQSPSPPEAPSSATPSSSSPPLSPSSSPPALQMPTWQITVVVINLSYRVAN
ncbi:hypothetical protein AURDEDRAFT_171618 [Auricularia subglabra TFB-10046 SS5]|nr:hypothetical protein AURDEDRAFT_171618 [Auricularia subglabra TFB-10046 SS5]